MRLLIFRSAFVCAVTALLLVNNVAPVGAERFRAKEEVGSVPARRGAVIRTAPPAPVFDDNTRLTELAGRRTRVARSIGEKGILILFSTEPRVYTNDVDYEYRQENNLYYLTNLKQKGATLVLTPSNHIAPAILFLPRRNPVAETWTGHMYSPEEASQISGIKEIWDPSEFEPFMRAFRNRQPYRPKPEKILMSANVSPPEGSGATATA
ncbi:MAG TPA: aminopeptidase P N-terminal domain-containing protein, partial [Pyrinomonadaceae bacterium]|nr:aminopeptidase P N-terminal domain-containing protein [Pyrinomonadaceae bacterium]